MESENKIRSELAEFAPVLMKLEAKTVYQVPDLYFAQLPEKVVSQINRYNLPATPSNPFSVSAGYFEELANKVLEKVQNETDNEVEKELAGIAPILNQISKKLPYSIPASYFDTLKVDDTGLAEQRLKLKTIRGKNIVRYLAAAVIAGVLAVSTFVITGKNSDNHQNSAPQAVNKVRGLSEQEIIDFLKTNSPTESIVSTSTNGIKDSDIKSSVSKMSDKEIKDFLADFGDESEM